MMKRYLLWLWLAGKRLLKKPLFLVLLLMMPVFTLCYTAAVENSSGVVNVVLAVDGDADAVTAQVMDRLTADSGMIRFVSASAQEARMLVEAGKADAAWIFPGDLEGRIAEFLEDGSSSVVRVLQREENVLLRLSREKLSGALYDSCAAPVYLRYLRENAPRLEGLSDQQLTAYMDRFRGNDRLFAFEQTDGSPAEPGNYLISPLRGLLGVLILLCALAAAMYFLQDKDAGMFQCVPASVMGAVEFGSQLAALWSVSLVAMVCLAVCGLWAGIWREVTVTGLYMLCCGSFACLLRRLCGKVHMLAGLLPVLTVAALAICPVFVDISALRALQYLLPPTYYIRAADSDGFLLLMAAYAGACMAGYWLVGKTGIGAEKS